MTIRRTPSTLLLVEHELTRQLVTATRRPWMSVRARLHGNSLDRQLARGTAPETRPVLANMTVRERLESLAHSLLACSSADLSGTDEYVIEGGIENQSGGNQCRSVS
jgi:hypothetical protein